MLPLSGGAGKGGGRGEEIVSSKVITGMSQAVCLPQCRRGACDFHGRRRAAVWRGGGGGERGEPEIAAVDFIVLKSRSRQRDARRRTAVPPLSPHPFHLNPPAPPQEGGVGRERVPGFPGGSRGRCPAAARTGTGQPRRGCSGGSGDGFLPGA